MQDDDRSRMSMVEVLTQPEMFRNQGKVVSVNMGAQVFSWTILTKDLIYNGKQCNMLLIRDITHLKQLEEVHSKNRALNLLTATISHEMLMPIMCIIMYCQECLSYAIPDEVR